MRKPAKKTLPTTATVPSTQLHLVAGGDVYMQFPRGSNNGSGGGSN